MQPGSATNPTAASTASDVLGNPPGPNGKAPASPAPAGGGNPAPAPDPANPAAGAADPKVSGKLQLLIQRERAASDRERAAKSKEAEIAKREAQLQAFEGARGNPLKALELLGLTYQDLTKAQLADGQLPPETEIRKLGERIDGVAKTVEEQRAADLERARKEEERRHTQTIERFKGDIGKYLKENANRYELISFEGQEDLVYEVIDENFNRTLKAEIEKALGLEADPQRTLEEVQQLAQEAELDVSEFQGQVLTIAEAADKVELHLEQKYEKARDLAKVKTLYGRAPRPAPNPVPPAPKKPAEKPNPQKPSQTLTTLTNELSATPSKPQGRVLTDEERKAKAIAYFRSLRP